VARNDDRFAGRVALVTGGSSGIGAATVRRLLAEGAKVASLDLDGGAPDGALTLHGDVSDSQQVEAAVARAASELGPIDVLVCSAGITGASISTVDVSDDEWRRVMAIDADGVFFCNRAVLPGMIERGYGRIVNVASIAGKEGNPMAAAYSAAKAAVIAMTKAIGKDVARTGVVVNCIAPAVIETPILDGLAQSHIDYMIERIPMGRMGTPDEVATLACWLASEECSFSTGATYDISGGRAVYGCAASFAGSTAPAASRSASRSTTRATSASSAGSRTRCRSSGARCSPPREAR
jgi:3-oxoacyl-[acyl-carrier protein] reductase